MNQTITLKEKIGYGLGDTASQFIFSMVGGYLTFFYTDMFGISAGAVGTLFLVVRLWDAINDPIMGAVADRTRTRWGRFRPYLLWFSLPFAVVGFLAFTTPPWGGTAKLVYAWVTYILLMMVYTAINIPYSALSGVMTAEHRERTSLNAFRMGLANIGGIIVAGATLPLVGLFGGDNQGIGFSRTMALYGVIAVVLFLLCFRTTRERISPPPEKKSGFREDLTLLFKNRPWVIVFLIGVSTFTFFTVRMSVILYYFTYLVGDQAQAGLFMSVTSVVGVFGVMFTKLVSSRLGKRGTFILGHSAALLSFSAFYIAPPKNLGIIYALQVLGTTGFWITVPLIWSMIADTADYAEWKFGERRTGLIFSAATFSHKFGMGLGGALTGALLSAFGYQAAAAQTAQALNGLTLMMSFIPAIGSVLVIVLVLFYELNDQLCDTMKQDLDQRRQERESGHT